MRSQDMRDGTIASKVDEPLIAGDECGKIRYVQSARIKAVACKKNSRGSVVQGDTCLVVPRNRDHIERAASKIHVTDVRRPALNSKRRLNLRHGGCDELDVRLAFELGITGGVVAVRVRMHHNERNRIFLVTLGPLRDDTHHGACRIDLPGTRVFQQSSIATEYQVEERLLIMCAPRLAQN